VYVLPRRLIRLASLFARLPGVGEKTAQRFVMHLLTDEQGLAQSLAKELADIRSMIQPCETCRNWAELDESGRWRCSICRDTQRDTSLICVVGKVQDLLALERSHVLRCRYFVLGQLLSPLEGVHAEQLPTEELAERIRADHVREVIIATPPTVDGEATALHLVRELSPLGVSFSRIASGIPHGGDLEYSDQVTLGRALLGRRPLVPETD
jgi:recombination protein RecR